MRGRMREREREREQEKGEEIRHGEKTLIPPNEKTTPLQIKLNSALLVNWAKQTARELIPGSRRAPHITHY